LSAARGVSGIDSEGVFDPKQRPKTGDFYPAATLKMPFESIY
jgi:hypothetical protein